MDPFTSALRVCVCRPRFGDVWRNGSGLRRRLQSLRYLVRQSCLRWKKTLSVVYPSVSHFSQCFHLILLWPLFFLTPQWAIHASRTLIWGWFLCCEYHYTQLKPNCRLIELRKYVFSHVTVTDTSGMSNHHLKSAKNKKIKKDLCEFSWFFEIYLLWNLSLWFLSGSGDFLPVGPGSAQRCKSGLSRASASQN